jgi:hypothetical protein
MAGARRIGSGAFVRDAAPGQQVAVGMAAIGRAIVGHDALDRRTVPGEPLDRAAGEGHRAFLALVGQQRADSGRPADGTPEVAVGRARICVPLATDERFEQIATMITSMHLASLPCTSSWVGFDGVAG